MTARVLAVAIAALLGQVCIARAQPGVKVLVGFEWEEFAPKVGRSMVIGKPISGPPKAGFRAQRYKSLEEVGPEGFQIFYPKSSRDHAGPVMVRRYATEGEFAWKCRWTRREWRWRLGQLKRRWPGVWPPHEPLYDVYDHFFQRECQLFRKEWRFADWRGYARLRFDVRAEGAPLVLGVRVRDGSGPLVRGKPTGIRTALARFTVPADRTVTCDFPLREMARVAEMDLSRIHRLNIRLNGFPADRVPTALYIDNIRLVEEKAEAKPRFELVRMEGEVRPFARPVVDRGPTPRDPKGLERDTGPVEPLGPVVVNPTALYRGPIGHGSGHFGGSGATYFSNSRRAVVAYDNRRLLVVIGGRTRPGGRGGTLAIASFDGGKTWRGLRPEDGRFTILKWYLRSNFFADRFGNLYALGTPNCDSYNEGQDICIHRLCFTGRTWVDDRFAIIHQDGYKCPSYGQALMLASGRIWAAWNDGFGGSLARYSDDDGFTFEPCKDASLAPPRPFYDVVPRDYRRVSPPKPPREILIWPTPTVVGPFLVPYKGQVAAFTADGGKWQVHDGEKWGPVRKGAKIGGLLTVAVLGEDHIFLCRGAGYSNRGKELLADLVVADLQPDGSWRRVTLEGENVTSAILTASGDAMYCFYVKKVSEGKYEIHYRRWRGGRWEEAVKVAEETRRINHLAAPQFSPPDYAALFWDQHFREEKDASEVKFLRVPNR